MLLKHGSTARALGCLCVPVLYGCAAPDHILATARYVLHRGDSVTGSGPFTLILERREDTWKIIHDHTNADPN